MMDWWEHAGLGLLSMMLTHNSTSLWASTIHPLTTPMPCPCGKWTTASLRVPFQRDLPKKPTSSFNALKAAATRTTSGATSSTDTNSARSNSTTEAGESHEARYVPPVLSANQGKKPVDIDAIQSMGLLAVKLGQIFALRPDLIDPDRCIELQQLYSRAQPFQRKTLNASRPLRPRRIPRSL